MPGPERTLYQMLFPTPPVSKAPPFPEYLGENRPTPMTLDERVRAIFGGFIGLPRPYKNDPQYERMAALGEGGGLAGPAIFGMAAGGIKAGVNAGKTLKTLAQEAALVSGKTRAPKSTWSSTIKNAILENGGYSVDPRTGITVAPGTKDAVMVGAFPNDAKRTMVIPAAEFTEKHVDQFKKINADVLANDSTAHIGGWLQKDDAGNPKTVYLDVSKKYPTERQAIKVGEEQNPGAIALPHTAGQKKAGIPRQWEAAGHGRERDPVTGKWPQAQFNVWNAETGAEPAIGNLSEFVNSPEFQTRLHEMATAGKSAMGPEFKNWWDITKGPLARVYGDEMIDKVSGLLAATSPQNGPINNTQLASELLRRAIKGEAMVQPEWRAPMNMLGGVAKPGGPLPMTNSWANNAQKVVEGRGAEISSDKVNDMRRALLGDPDVAVIDRHYAKLAEDPARGIYTNVEPNTVATSMGTGKREAYPDIENQVRTAAKQAGVPLANYSAWVWEGIRDTIRKTGNLYGQLHRSSAVPETTTGFNEIFTDLVAKKAKHLGMSVEALEQKLRSGDAELLGTIISTGAGAAAYQRFKESQAQPNVSMRPRAGA